MSTEHTPGQELSMKDLAAQLRQPSGDTGKEVALNMNQSNRGMIRESIALLSAIPGARILELGHGNGRHIGEWLQQEPGAVYTGLECSELMQAEAITCSEEEGFNERARFLYYDGSIIPFPDHEFDRILTVNTLYFWEDPEALLNELYRVLQKGGYCCITFGDKSSMDQLPFTQYGFAKYDIDGFTRLVSASPFTIDALHTREEDVESNSLGQTFHRIYHIAILQKQ